MTKSELIEKLNEIPGNPEVKIYDHRKLLHHASDEPTNEGLYGDFDVHQLNDDLSKEDLNYAKEVHEIELKPFIVLSFDNDDYDEDGSKVEEP